MNKTFGKKFQQVMAGAIALLMMVCCVLPSLQSAQAAKKVTYVALGDSIAAGYGLEGYSDKAGKAAPADSYQTIVGNALNATVINDAKSGITSDELLKILTDKKVAKDLKKADYVTVSIGSNDVLGVFVQYLLSALKAKDIDEAKAIIKKQVDSGDMMASIAFAQQIGEGLKDNQDILQVAQDFSGKFEEIVAAIKEAAPNAKIYATNVYNPFAAVTSDMLPLGPIADQYINELNNAFDKESEDYTVIDANKAFADGKETNVKFDMTDLDNTCIDPHPNKLGQSKLAKLLLKAMDVKADATVAELKSVKSTKANTIQLKVKGADSYTIMFSNSKDGSFKKLDTAKKATMTITSKKLKSGKTYYVAVVVGDGEMSAAQKVVVK